MSNEINEPGRIKITLTQVNVFTFKCSGYLYAQKIFPRAYTFEAQARFQLANTWNPL